MEEELEWIEETELDEKELLKGFNYSSEVLDTVKAYLIEIGKFKVYPKEELLLLIQRYKNGETYLRDTIINSNLRLVVYIVKKERKYENGEDFLDCIQDGNIGLMKALEKFDPNLGYSFSTYSYHWIRQAINRNYQNNSNAIRIPAHLLDKLNQYKKLKDRYLHLYGRIPTREETQNELSIIDSSVDLLFIADNIYGNIGSLNQVVNDADCTQSEVGDFVSSLESGYDKVESNWNDRVLLINLKHKLSPLAYYVLYSRYVRSEKMTLEDIAREFLLTRKRIWQIENSALEKVRRDIIHIQKKEGVDYSLSNQEIYPIPYQQQAVLYYVKGVLSDFDYYLFYHFIYQNEPITDYFHSMDIESVEKRIKELKQQYQSLFSDYEAYKEMYQKNFEQLGSTMRESIFTFRIEPIDVNYRNIAEFLENLSLKEAHSLLDGDYSTLPERLQQSFDTYYKGPSKEVYLSDIRKVIIALNLKKLNYNQKEFLPLELLKDTLLKSKDKFKENKYRDLMLYLFNKEDIEEFDDEKRETVSYGLHRLESMYYNMDNYFYYEIPKENLLAILHNPKNKFHEEEIELIHLRYEKCLSINEIALMYHFDYIYCHDYIRSIHDRIVLIYLEKSTKTIKIDAPEKYKKYVYDVRYPMTEEARSIAKLFLYENLEYKEIQKRLGIASTTRVSNILTDTIRKMDMWYYGILDESIYELEDIKQVWDVYSYSDVKRKVIYNRFVQNKSNDENAEEMHLSKDEINGIVSEFIRYYNTYFSKKELTIEDYKREIKLPTVDSILTIEGRIVLALKEGILSEYNCTGEKYNLKQIMDMTHFSENKVRGILKRCDYMIGCRLKGLIKPTYSKYTKEELVEIVEDENIPLSDKEREILKLLKGIGCPPLSDKEIGQKVGMTRSSLFRRIQKSYLTIAKYKDEQMNHLINYDRDVFPRLKYFPKVEQDILIKIYKEKRKRKEIAQDYGLEVGPMNEILKKIDKRLLYIMKCPLAKTFDFDYARGVMRENIPFHGDKERMIQIYNRWFGDDGKLPFSTMQMIQMFDLRVRAPISIWIKNFMVSILKYQDGIQKSKCLSYTEIDAYYRENKQIYSFSNQMFFEDVLARLRTSQNLVYKEDEIYNNFVTYEVLKSKIKMPIGFDLTEEEVLEFIKHRKEYGLSKANIEDLLIYYKIPRRKMMSFHEKIELYNYLNNYISSYKKRLNKEEVLLRNNIKKNICEIKEKKETIDNSLYNYREIMNSILLPVDSESILIMDHLPELLFAYIRRNYKDICVVSDTVLMKMVYQLQKAFLLAGNRDDYLRIFTGKLTIQDIQNNSYLDEETSYFWTRLIERNSPLIHFHRNASRKEVIRNTISFQSNYYVRLKQTLPRCDISFANEIPNKYFQVIDLGYRIGQVSRETLGECVEHLTFDGQMRGYGTQTDIEALDLGQYKTKVLRMEKSHNQIITIQRGYSL